VINHAASKLLSDAKGCRIQKQTCKKIHVRGLDEKKLETYEDSIQGGGGFL
jgi:hypothetical protein